MSIKQHRTYFLRRAMATPVLVFGLLVLSSCSSLTNLWPGTWFRVYEGEEIQRRIRSLPADIPIVFSGLSYYRGVLYAATNVGVLRIPKDNPTQLIGWYPSDDVVSGPWMDRAGDQLWVFHSGLGTFFRYDGHTWLPVALPDTPGRGVRRGDLFELKGRSSRNAFWIEGDGSAWKWNADSGAWSLTELPKGLCWPSKPEDDSWLCFAAIAPTEKREYIVMHSQLIPRHPPPTESKADRPTPDQVIAPSARGWENIDSTGDLDFVAKDVISTPVNVYMLSYFGPLYKVDEAGISRIESLGDVEAMTGTADGRLIVSFKGQGVFQYRDRWEKLFDCPYAAGYPIRDAKLSEDGGRIAYAVNVDRNKRSGAEKSHLWLYSADSLIEVMIAEKNSARKE